jgi:Holliday junction resolvase RusA-like endonuclease
VRVQLDVYRPAKRGDIDNFGKVLLDSVQGFGYVNDSQIVELVMRRYDDKANPRVELTVEEVRAG